MGPLRIFFCARIRPLAGDPRILKAKTRLFFTSSSLPKIYTRMKIIIIKEMKKKTHKAKKRLRQEQLNEHSLIKAKMPIPKCV